MTASNFEMSGFGKNISVYDNTYISSFFKINSITNYSSFIDLFSSYKATLPVNADSELNDLTKILFIPELSNNYPTSLFKPIMMLFKQDSDVILFDTLNVYLGDNRKSDCQINEIIDYITKNNAIEARLEHLYYVRCDIRNPRFKEAFRTLTKDPNINSYLVDTYMQDEFHLIMRFKVSNLMKYKKFINNQITEIHNNNYYFSLSATFDLLRFYYVLTQNQDTNTLYWKMRDYTKLLTDPELKFSIGKCKADQIIEEYNIGNITADDIQTRKLLYERYGQFNSFDNLILQ